MARSRIDDMMQSHRFWLVDVMPSATFPFFVLGSPTYAFQAITAPEITLDTQEVAQVNSMFKRYVYSGGSVGPITLTRGCRTGDDTFYQWVKKAIRGSDTTNRDLLLIHYTGVETDLINVAEVVAATLTFGLSAAFGFGPAQVSNVPGRAWMLWDCIPTRYKASSDFDATSAEVSLMELDMQPFAIEEFVLGSGGSI